MIAHQKPSLEDSFNKSRIVDEVAKMMDRKFKSFHDSCSSFLWNEYDELAKKPSCVNVALLYRALMWKAFDYYRTHHLRHARREIEGGEFPLVSRSEISDSLRFDISAFTESLNVEEKLIWCVVAGEKTGVEVAAELGIRAQSVCPKVAKLKKRAKIHLKDYEYDCN